MSNSNILGPYNPQCKHVDYSQIGQEIYGDYQLHSITHINVRNFFLCDRLNLTFPWLNYGAYFYHGAMLSHPEVWLEVFKDMSGEERSQVKFANRTTGPTSLYKLATDTSDANKQLFILATQICLLGALAGNDVDLFRNPTAITEMPRITARFYDAAELVAGMLEVNSVASSPEELERRMRSMFAPLQEDSSIIFQSLQSTEAFGRCPFAYGTRLLFNQYYKWMQSVPLGELIHHPRY